MSAPAPLHQKFLDYLRLMRLDKPVGIWLLLWPTLWALCWASGGWPALKLLLVFVLGTVLMRSAGCVINDLADRRFDPHVARTRERPIAAGRVTPGEAVRLFVVLCLIAFGLVTQLDETTVVLSIPAVLLAASYPLVKRVTHLPQAYLGIAFSWGIPMAFSATGDAVDWPLALLLMAANLCWVIAYDTLYAIVDREDDLRIGVRSTAILFGRHDLLAVSVLHAAAGALLAVAGYAWGRGAAYFAGLAVAALIAAVLLAAARSRTPATAFRAFRHSHWCGLAVLVGLLADFYR